jgi:hypothetical protein
MTENSTTRVNATRQLLIDMVDAEGSPAPRPQTRRRRHSILAGLGAFILAGALTGGAVSAVAAVVGNQRPDTLSAEEAVQSMVGTHGHLIGNPFVYSGTGATQIALGSKPAGATGLVLSIDCMTSNDITATVLDQGDASSGECNGTSAQEFAVKDSVAHTLRISPAGSRKYAVWVSWVKEPPLPGPSAQQAAELADGKVTFPEELAAYNRYVGCLTAAGYPMGVVPTSGPYISYAVTGAAVDSGADARCYASEFKEVDSMWQGYANQVIEICLTAHGVAIPHDHTQADYLDLMASHRLTFDGCEATQK